MLSDHKRVRSFGSGPVGLRIVAAMIHDPKPVATSPKKSDPIMIYPSVEPTDETEEEDMEEYTCVTTRVGGRAVRMRVYLDSGSGPAGEEVLGDCGEFGREGGVFSESVGRDVGHDDGLEFLRRCYLCRKKLHGLDIFMYRGDKAFCSEECRYQQILSDEHKAKCKTKSGKSFDYSVSPYPSPLLFAAGVAAA